MALDVVPQADAADFFFTFNQNFDVDGKFAVELMERFERLQMDVNLAFIVGSAAAIDISIAHFGLKGRGGPEFQGFRGLDVIVTVEKHRRFAGGFQGFRVHEWVKAGGDDFDGLETGAPKAIRNPSGGAIDVWLVLALDADRGDPEKFVELPEVLLAATFYKFSKVHRRPPGAMIMVQINLSNYLKMMKKSAAAVWS